MASVSRTDLGVFQDLRGRRIRRAVLAVTGLTQSSDNQFAHGLPNAPTRVSYVPTADGTWYEKAAPDATNLDIHVNASGPQTFRVNVEY
jgi:hypothetical protein